jgi:hypothetical protein
MATVATPAARNLADSLAIGTTRVAVGRAAKSNGFTAKSLAMKVMTRVLPAVTCLAVPLTLTTNHEVLQVVRSVGYAGQRRLLAVSESGEDVVASLPCPITPKALPNPSGDTKPSLPRIGIPIPPCNAKLEIG